MEKKFDKFWLTYIEKRGSPSYRHETLESAKAEAERLARKEKSMCYVLECVGAVQVVNPVPPVEWIEP